MILKYFQGQMILKNHLKKRPKKRLGNLFLALTFSYRYAYHFERFERHRVGS